MPDLGSTDDGRAIDKRQPELVCLACVEVEAGEQNNFPQWNMGQCDCCGRKTAVAHPKYWGMMNEGWEKRINRVRPVEEA